MGFLYFLPNAERRKIDTLAAAREVGLGYAFERDEQVMRRPITAAGPGGTPGLLVCDARLFGSGLARVDLESQKWRQCTPLVEGDPSVFSLQPLPWVGRHRESGVKLEDYRRDDPVDGRPVELDDGQVIHAPIARQYTIDETTPQIVYSLNLPRTLDVDSDGQLTQGEVTSRYRLLWDLAQAYDQASANALADALEGEDNAAEISVSFEFKQINVLVDLILKTNYRFGLQEILALGLYTTALQHRLVEVLLDNDSFVRLQKKMVALLAARVSTSSSIGPGESKPDAGAAGETTAPPSPTGEPSPSESTDKNP